VSVKAQQGRQVILGYLSDLQIIFHLVVLLLSNHLVIWFKDVEGFGFEIFFCDAL
jgi:hypothetical protein